MISIYVSIYNRAQKVREFLPQVMGVVDEYNTSKGHIFDVCYYDNASEDATCEVLNNLASKHNFRIHVNAKNIGILGNLKAIAEDCQNPYFWILGDDDVPTMHGLQKIADAVIQQPDLIYVGYRPVSKKIVEYRPFQFGGRRPKYGQLLDIALDNKMFFTSIYTLVFSKVLGQKTYGYYNDTPYFSSLRATVPTTEYLLRYALDASVVSIPSTCVEVGLDVTWGSHILDWTLVKLPEVFEILSQIYGDDKRLNFWKLEHCCAIARDVGMIEALPTEYERSQVKARIEKMFGEQLNRYSLRKFKF